MFGTLGIWEILLIVLIIILLFGAKRLPELGSSIGEGIKNFKKSLNNSDNKLDTDDEENESKRE